ncbi:MAG TPA: hypothetical protein DEH78_03435, partial [Solibacterales bacterium]|nr:hypothetical protein [Bryobacterales bacterium]
RRAFHEQVFERYDADLAQNLFYSTMRLIFDEIELPVEYGDDGLAERWHILGPGRLWSGYPACPPRLTESVRRAILDYGFRGTFADLDRECGLAAQRVLEAWRSAA